MDEYCQNPLCESPSYKEVPVSVERVGDECRALCVSCEEAYSWGVQHGMMAGEPEKISAFLREGGFVVLGMNRTDPSQGAGIEAWAYQGPLDFNVAKPVRFGLGETCHDALRTLRPHTARKEFFK